MIYDRHNETHEKYIQAMKSLDAHNMVAEHTKVPDTKEEESFMHETNHARTSQSFGLNISEERWNAIFVKDALIDAIEGEPSTDEMLSLQVLEDILRDMFEDEYGEDE